jgi:hypothetical protein
MAKLISKKKLRKMLRYTVMFLAIVLLLKLVPTIDIDNMSVLIISTITAITFVLLDIYYPIIYMD